MLCLTCTMISNVDIGYYGVFRAKDWVSVDSCTMISNVYLGYYGVSRAKDWVSVDSCTKPNSVTIIISANI